MSLNPFNKRNVFNLSHEWKGTLKMGELVPILATDIVPGDTWRDQTDIVLRVSPMLAPIMHEVNVYTHFFFVPNRLIWSDWESFITGGVDGQDNSVAPYITAGEGGFAVGSLADYLGLPTGVAGITCSALPFRAYSAIYNTWYRDQNLISEVALSTASGSDTTTNTTLLNRCWEKDYFTSALPWPQRGPATYLPLGVSAPVVGDGKVLGITDGTNNFGLSNQGNNTWGCLCYPGLYGDDVGSTDLTGNIPFNVGLGVVTDNTKSGLKADLSEATAATINDIRLAFQVQRWMEKNARSGARYIESILAHFGVRSSDARLQRPEYLGGGRSPVIVSEVLQTSATDSTSPQANMAGHGFSAQRTHEFTKSFEEHGWIIGLLSVMPKTSYQQGIPRRFSRSTRYDYLWPVFSHLGEQAVLNKELYAQGTSDDAGVFGYQGRYDEYRRMESSVHGEFRSTLNYWHMGRIFDSLPTLSSTFVTSDPTMRISADTTTDNIYVEVGHKIKAIRPLPKYGSPGLIDHD